MKPKNESRTLVDNRQARHNYHIEERYTAGLVLEGWEVKGILAGTATFNGGNAYVKIKNGEAFLESLTITPLKHTYQGLLQSLVPGRPRKLLLTKAELSKLGKRVAENGYTIVPLTLQAGPKIKLEIGLAKGKNHADKRETIKNRDVDREIQRATRQNMLKTA